MKKSKLLLTAIITLFISGNLFSQQYKAFNVNGSVVGKWCNWETTTYKYEDLKTTEKVTDDAGRVLSTKVQSFYPDKKIKTETVTVFSYTDKNDNLKATKKEITKTEFSESGSLQKKSNTKTDSLNPAIDSLKEEYEYYDDGFIKSKKITEDSYGRTKTTTTSYNSYHFITDYSSITTENSCVTSQSTKTYKWQFNSEGKPLKLEAISTSSSKETKLFLDYTWKYTKTGKLEYFSYYDQYSPDRKKVYTFEYNENDLLTSEKYYDLPVNDSEKNCTPQKENQYKYTEDKDGHLIKFEVALLSYGDYISERGYSSKDYIGRPLDFLYDSNGQIIQVTGNIEVEGIRSFPFYLAGELCGTHYSNPNPKDYKDIMVPSTKDIITHYHMEKTVKYLSLTFPYNKLPKPGYYEYDKNGNALSVPGSISIRYDSNGNPFEIIDSQYSYYFEYMYVENNVISNSTKDRIVLNKNECISVDKERKLYRCQKDANGRIFFKTYETNNEKEEFEYSYYPSGVLRQETYKQIEKNSNPPYIKDLPLKDKSKKTFYNANGLISKITDLNDSLWELYVYKFNDDGSVKSKIRYIFKNPTDFM